MQYFTGPLAAFDIETDTSSERYDPAIPAGLDPRASAVTSVAVVSDAGLFGLDDTDEYRLLDMLAKYISKLPSSSTLFTWNGAVFDMPYIDYRSKAYSTLDMGLDLTYNPDIPVKYSPLPEYQGGYDAFWFGHTHVDISGLYKPLADSLGIRHGLKPVAACMGLSPISEDAANASDLTAAQRAAYNLSDSEVTLKLAKMVKSVPAIGEPVAVLPENIEVIRLGRSLHRVLKDGRFHAFISGKEVIYNQ